MVSKRICLLTRNVWRIYLFIILSFSFFLLGIPLWWPFHPVSPPSFSLPSFSSPLSLPALLPLCFPPFWVPSPPRHPPPPPPPPPPPRRLRPSLFLYELDWFDPNEYLIVIWFQWFFVLFWGGIWKTLCAGLGFFNFCATLPHRWLIWFIYWLKMDSRSPAPISWHQRKHELMEQITSVKYRLLSHLIDNESLSIVKKSIVSFSNWQPWLRPLPVINSAVTSSSDGYHLFICWLFLPSLPLPRSPPSSHPHFALQRNQLKPIAIRNIDAGIGADYSIVNGCSFPNPIGGMGGIGGMDHGWLLTW